MPFLFGGPASRAAQARVYQSLAVRNRLGVLGARQAARYATRRALVSSGLGLGAYAGVMGARMIYRRRRRAVSRAKRNYIRRKARIGKPPFAKRPCKCLVMANSLRANKSNYEVHVTRLDFIAKASGAHTEQTRESDYVHIKGWRINKFFENVNAFPTMHHVVLLTSKVHDSSAILDDTATGKTNVKEDLFRDETVASRVLTPNSTTDGLIWNHSRINTDRWIVLKRYRKLLAGTEEPDRRKRQWHFNRYVKFNRQLHYDDSDDIPESNRSILIHFAVAPGANSITDPTSVEASHSGYDHTSEIRCFFRDINPR